ncbi:MAG: twin-arginine translocase subunit TatC [Chloroflexota bacterium]|nr:twin-arginine translocase subunit TatC [Chloroflexota bacterium]
MSVNGNPTPSGIPASTAAEPSEQNLTAPPTETPPNAPVSSSRPIPATSSKPNTIAPVVPSSKTMTAIPAPRPPASTPRMTPTVTSGKAIPPVRPTPPIKPPTPPVDIIDEGEPSDGHDLRMGIFDHLNELRGRLFKAALALVIATALSFLFAGQVLEYFKAPYPEKFIALGPTDAVVAYFRIALLCGAIMSIPITTYQILMFIIPGLTNKEKGLLLRSIPAITGLFLIGAAFAWFLLIPPAVNFLDSFQSELFQAQWTADRYLGFITALIFWMGVAFESPLIFFVLALLGQVSAPTLIKNWRLAIVGTAAAAAFITPTVDPVNMFLVMAPLLVLYVLSIFLVVIGRRISRVEAAV